MENQSGQKQNRHATYPDPNSNAIGRNLSCTQPQVNAKLAACKSGSNPPHRAPDARVSTCLTPCPIGGHECPIAEPLAAQFPEGSRVRLSTGVLTGGGTSTLVLSANTGGCCLSFPRGLTESPRLWNIWADWISLAGPSTAFAGWHSIPRSLSLVQPL